MSERDYFITTDERLGELSRSAEDAAETLPADCDSFCHAGYANLFWVGIVAYRLPAAYDQTQYLLNTAGLDLHAFYRNQGMEAWINHLGSILRPSLLLGGTTVAYWMSSDPLVLLVAANQPGFSGNNDLLSSGIHYLTAILFLARAYAHLSPYTVPLMALQGTSLVSHVLFDTGLVAEDNAIAQFMRSVTSMASEIIGLFLYPDLPIKALQGITVLAQGMHCAELAWEHMVPYLPFTYVQGEIAPDAEFPCLLNDSVSFTNHPDSQ